MKTAITAAYFVLSVMVLLLSSDNFKSALVQAQQQLQSYHSPTLGISIQHPSDWQIDEIRPNAIDLYIQKGIVYVSISSDELDSPLSSSATSADLNAQLVEYVSSQIDDRRENKEDFTLMESSPVTIAGNSPAYKALYTFIKGEEETNPGEINKVFRIWTVKGDKAYTIAYVAEQNQYDQFLPTFQRIVDSFKIGTSTNSSTTQVQSSDSDGEDNNERPLVNGDGNCDRASYPDVCIPPYPPDLNCPDISYKNFRVTDTDPHGFDRNKDGIGCESASGEDKPTPMPGPEAGNGDGCVEVNGYLLSEGSYLDERGRIVGSPCNPEEFCSNPDSTDPTVIDHCSDGWEEIYERCWDGTFVESEEDCPPESESIGYCNPGLEIIDGICGPYVPGEAYCQALGCPGSPPDLSRPVTRTPMPPVTPTPEPTPTRPIPPFDPSLLARSQPQCEFGANPQTGLCNTADIPSESLTPTQEPLTLTPEPTIAPDEGSSMEEEVEEESEEEPQEGEGDPEDSGRDEGEENNDVEE